MHYAIPCIVVPCPAILNLTVQCPSVLHSSVLCPTVLYPVVLHPTISCLTVLQSYDIFHCPMSCYPMSCYLTVPCPFSSHVPLCNVLVFCLPLSMSHYPSVPVSHISPSYASLFFVLLSCVPCPMSLSVSLRLPVTMILPCLTCHDGLPFPQMKAGHNGSKPGLAPCSTWCHQSCLSN